MLLSEPADLVTLGLAPWTGQPHTRGQAPGVRDRGLEEGLQRIQREHRAQEGRDAEVSDHLVVIPTDPSKSLFYLSTLL